MKRLTAPSSQALEGVKSSSVEEATQEGRRVVDGVFKAIPATTLHWWLDKFGKILQICSEVKGKIYGGVLIKIQFKMLIFNGFGRKWALVCFQLCSCSLEFLYPKICSL